MLLEKGNNGEKVYQDRVGRSQDQQEVSNIIIGTEKAHYTINTLHYYCCRRDVANKRGRYIVLVKFRIDKILRIVTYTKGNHDDGSDSSDRGEDLVKRSEIKNQILVVV